MYALLKKNVVWSWTPEAQKSFECSKDTLASSSVLAHFDTERSVKLTVDASEKGLGAIISHVLERGIEKPIAFASRLLNDAEKSYSQIEKEAAAIIFVLKKFYQYLYAKKFVLVTDHKQLLTIFGNKKGLPMFAANRLLRWAHILTAFDFTIQYVPSDKNQADCLSRLPLSTSQKQKETISYLHFIGNSDIPVDFK